MLVGSIVKWHINNPSTVINYKTNRFANGRSVFNHHGVEESQREDTTARDCRELFDSNIRIFACEYMLVNISEKMLFNLA